MKCVSITILVFIGFYLLAMPTASVGRADTENTSWLSKKEINAFARTSRKQRWYPIAIECRQSSNMTLFRLTYRSFTIANKPFHKWNWVHGRADKMRELVASLPRRGRLDLKYRIVAKGTYRTPGGTKMGCAVAFR